MDPQEPVSPPAEWDGVLRREANLTVRAVDEKRRAVRFLASTTTIDSHGDIVQQTWRLERYLKNPVVLWNHERWGDDIVIGRGEDVQVTPSGLEITVVFVPKELSERAEKTYRMVVAGFLNAGSVGFRPGSVKLDESVGERDVYRLDDNELYEFSIVPIPSNPDSVARRSAEETRFLQRMAGAPAQRSLEFEDNPGRAAADSQQESSHMDKDEKQALEVKAAAAEKIAEERATEIKALKAENDALAKSVDEHKAGQAAAEARVKELEDKSIADEVEKLVGVKITPAEREEHVQLAKDIGVERVKTIVSKRPDIKLTETPAVSGKELGGPQTAPTPVSGSFGDAGNSIVTTARSAAGKTN
ncbi:MAG: HK97 family phage prohead protease [Candidatus Deferrimicrobiaceae bacterium]